MPDEVVEDLGVSVMVCNCCRLFTGKGGREKVFKIT